MKSSVPAADRFITKRADFTCEIKTADMSASEITHLENAIAIAVPKLIFYRTNGNNIQIAWDHPGSLNDAAYLWASIQAKLTQILQAMEGLELGGNKPPQMRK